MEEIVTKKCPKCKRNKKVSDYNRHPTSKDGYRYQCKECNYKYGANPERRKKYSAKHHIKRKTENPELYLWKQAKHRAKFEYSGLEFTIEVSDILIPEICPYLKIKLEVFGKNWAPSLDRIDNTKGYIKGNIRVISNLANRMKTDASIEELVQFAKGVLDVHSEEVAA